MYNYVDLILFIVLQFTLNHYKHNPGIYKYLKYTKTFTCVNKNIRFSVFDVYTDYTIIIPMTRGEV